MSDVPANWTTAPLAEICDRIVDGSHNPPKGTANGHPMLSARNISDGKIVFDDFRWISDEDFAAEDARTRVKPGDVLLTIVGTIGRTAVVPESSKPFSLQRSVAVLKPATVASRYLAYCLESPAQQQWLLDNAKGTAQKGVYLKTLGSTRIPVAPTNEQTRIVEKLEELLSDLDAGVAELKAAQRKLAQYRQSLLKAAVEGALTADWRAARARSGEPRETGADLLQRILTERRARWEAKQLARYAEQGKTPPEGWQSKYPEPVAPDTTDLPKLPEGWAWATLDSLIKEGPQNGLYLPANRYGQGTPILRIDDYQIGWHRERDALNQVQADASSCETYALKSGDIVINRVNSMTHLGKCLEITAPLDGVLFESNMMRARLHESVSARFVSSYLGSVAGRARLTKDAKWAVNQASINQQDVRRTSVPLPSAEEQVAIVEQLEMFISAAESKLVAVELSLKQAAAQRKNILKAAFAGQLVLQDPNDEPASALLARIRADRADKTGTAKPRGRKPRITA